MATTTAPVAPPPEPIYRFTVAQYHDMIDAGILVSDDPIELLEGLLVTKMSKKPKHVMALHLLREALTKVLPSGWLINTQDPITLDDSEPEPDLSVIRGTRGTFADRHPNAREVGLIVEFADSSLARDRDLKKRVYARAGIPIYWIVNLPESLVEVYTGPTAADPPDYPPRQTFAAGDEVPFVLDGTEVARVKVSALLA